MGGCVTNMLHVCRCRMFTFIVVVKVHVGGCEQWVWDWNGRCSSQAHPKSELYVTQICLILIRYRPLKMVKRASQMVTKKAYVLVFLATKTVLKLYLVGKVEAQSHVWRQCIVNQAPLHRNQSENKQPKKNSFESLVVYFNQPTRATHLLSEDCFLSVFLFLHYVNVKEKIMLKRRFCR